VATTGDCRAMSCRIFKVPGPAKASAIAGVRSGSDLQAARRTRQKPRKCLTLYFTVPDNEDVPDTAKDDEYYCPRCQKPVPDPLACGDCSAIICRQCGTPLERVDELGIG
jgi:hypothetical protein